MSGMTATPRILVTGATGKVGRAFIARFLADGAFSRFTVRALCHNRKLEVGPRLEVITGSIDERGVAERNRLVTLRRVDGHESHHVSSHRPPSQSAQPVLGLIIPIPLFLPVCSAEDRIVFQGGSATSVTVLRTTDGGIMCWLFVNGLHGGPDLCTK